MSMVFVCDWDECDQRSVDLIGDEWDIYYPQGEAPPLTFCCTDHTASHILNSIAKIAEL